MEPKSFKQTVRILASGADDEAARLRDELLTFADSLRDEATAKGERLRTRQIERARDTGPTTGFTVR